MLILTEKPSVAKDFAHALGCNFSLPDRVYKSEDESIVIASCLGHLYRLAVPEFYDSRYKSWKNLPVIPKKFVYCVDPALESIARNVKRLLQEHKSDEILIATDADREGEVIARECILNAGLTDYSKIKRFWVSQALIPSVIKSGIKNAKPLTDYNKLSEQGFARQKADWIIGINITRFISVFIGNTYSVGRVQTAILSAIKKRCDEVLNFKKESYYCYQGKFKIKDSKKLITGTYFEEDKDRFSDTSKLNSLKADAELKVKVAGISRTKKNINPPLLYNLNDIQKEAYNLYGYSAEKTLSLIQTLYEKYKCVSYPRTVSKVMGTDNVQLCKDLYTKFVTACPEYYSLHDKAVIETGNKRVFDDSKLEAHHAIIPLEKVPASATGNEQNIFYMILERFMLAFAPCGITETVTAKVQVNNHVYEIKGQQQIEKGWKQFRTIVAKSESEEKEEQELLQTDFENLVLKDVVAVKKETKPQKLYNEASILSFMESPKNEAGKKLVGLGTPATRHTFIPKLLRSEFIDYKGKNLVITERGRKLLNDLNRTGFSDLTDISNTTKWEEELASDPNRFLSDIIEYIQKGTGGLTL